jgi:hypothetical protein
VVKNFKSRKQIINNRFKEEKNEKANAKLYYGHNVSIT